MGVGCVEPMMRLPVFPMPPYTPACLPLPKNNHFADPLRTQHGYNRTHFWFERAGARQTFDSFLGSLALTADQHPVSILEVRQDDKAISIMMSLGRQISKHSVYAILLQTLLRMMM